MVTQNHYIESIYHFLVPEHHSLPIFFMLFSLCPVLLGDKLLFLLWTSFVQNIVVQINARYVVMDKQHVSTNLTWVLNGNKGVR